VSRDGTKLLFSSNFGLQDQLNLPTEYSDAYLISLSGGSGGGGGTTEPPPPPPPPPPTVTRLEEGAGALVYSGNWVTKSSSLHSGGAAASAADRNAKVSLSFNGTGARWIAYEDEWSGMARVYVDGALVTKVDSFASPAKAQQTIYSVSGLAPGNHTLEIRVAHQKRKSSKGYWVWVDALEVVN
jgi:hypothetical protein